MVQRRLGVLAVQVLQGDVLPVLDVVWVDEATHDEGVAELSRAERRQLSLVDCVSFVLMRRLGASEAFCFDPHFQQAGFKTLPA